MTWMELAPQIITAGASLGGVLIGLLINGQRESERFKKQLEFEGRKLTYDRVRDVSVRLVRAHADQADQYEGRHWNMQTPYVTISIDALRAAADDRYVAETELGLLVPSLQDVIGAARSAIWKMDESEEPEGMSTNAWLDVSKAHQETLLKLEDEIRKVLSLEAPKKDKSQPAIEK